MAGTSSGSFYTTRVSGHYTFTLYWTITSQGRENGTTPYSMVSFVFKGKKDSSSQRWWDLNATHTFSVDGTTQSSGACSFDSRSWSVNTEYTIWQSSSDIKIYHNSAGQKTASMYFTLTTTGTDVGTFTVGGNATLLDIPMAGTLSLSASSVTISNSTGPSITATVGSYQSAFYYRLYFYIGSTQVEYKDFTSSTYAYTLGASTWGAKMTSSNSVTATATLYTYSNSARTTQIGSASSATFTVNYTIKPTADTPEVSASGYSAGKGLSAYYKGQTTATVTISNFAGSNGSTLKNYTFYQGGIAQSTQTNTSWTSGTLYSTGTVQFTVRVTDSRNNYVDKPVSITVVDYATPKITAYNAYRVTSGSTPETSGTKIYYSATAQATGTGNSITKMTVATSPVASSSTATVNNASSMSGTLNGAFSITQSYTVQFTATDQMGYSSTASILVQTAERIINVKANKKGIAFGKFAETTSAGDNLMDSAWAIKSAGNIEAGEHIVASGVNRANPNLRFKGKGDSAYAGAVLMDYGTNTPNSFTRMIMNFEVPALNSSGALNGKYEYFSLPSPTTNLSVNTQYRIVTNKGLVAATTYTFNSGYVTVNDSKITTSSVVFVQQVYNASGDTPRGWQFTTQVGNGFVNIYARDGSGNNPSNGSTAKLVLLIV